MSNISNIANFQYCINTSSVAILTLVHLAVSLVATWLASDESTTCPRRSTAAAVLLLRSMLFLSHLSSQACRHSFRSPGRICSQSAMRDLAYSLQCLGGAKSLGLVVPRPEKAKIELRSEQLNTTDRANWQGMSTLRTLLSAASFPLLWSDQSGPPARGTITS